MPMTAQQIEDRDFTYCQAFYEGRLGVPEFIVGTASRPEARERAQAFATARWGVPDRIDIYPRTYVRQARVKFARGLHD
jgi:hypothetical protein